MIFSSNCSNTNTFCSLVFIQLTNSYTLSYDVELIDKPFDSWTHIFYGQTTSSLLEGFLQTKWSFSQDINFMEFFVSFGILLYQIWSILCNFRSLFDFGVVHRKKLNFLNPTSKAINYVLKWKILKSYYRKLFLNCFIIN